MLHAMNATALFTTDKGRYLGQSSMAAPSCGIHRVRHGLKLPVTTRLQNRHGTRFFVNLDRRRDGPGLQERFASAPPRHSRLRARAHRPAAAPAARYDAGTAWAACSPGLFPARCSRWCSRRSRQKRRRQPLDWIHHQLTRQREKVRHFTGAGDAVFDARKADHIGMISTKTVAIVTSPAMLDT